MGNELEILIHLLEDPDPEVHASLYSRILAKGKDILPELEKASLDAASSEHFDRINKIIKELRFQDVKEKLSAWIKSDKPDLLEGILIISMLVEPDTSPLKARDLIKKLKNEIWLELNIRLTALEKVLILNHFLFKKNDFRPDPSKVNSIRDYSFNSFLSVRSGNNLMIHLFYAVISRQLALPVYGVDLPGVFLLSYIDDPIPEISHQPSGSPTLFLIHPAEKGRVFGIEEFQNFLSSSYPSFIRDKILPCSDVHLLKTYVTELLKTSRLAGRKELENKFSELLKLWLPEGKAVN